MFGTRRLLLTPFPLRANRFRSDLRSYPSDLRSRRMERSKLAVCASSTDRSPGLRDTYESLCTRLTTISTLEDVLRLLLWDELVAMPKGGSSGRGAQKSIIAGEIHDQKTAHELGQLISELSGDDYGGVLNEYEIAVVRDAKRNWARDTALTKDLVSRLEALKSKGNRMWMQARDEKDFKIFAPTLKEIFDMRKEIATRINPDVPPYDVLLDGYERGMTSERLNELFGDVKPFLVDLISQTHAAVKKNLLQSKFDLHRFEGSYDVSIQEGVLREVAKDIGYRMSGGRLDKAVHPFTLKMGGFSDVRITTRYNEKELFPGLMAGVHECGHGMYFQGMTAEYDGLPVATHASGGFDEGQALIWERYAGRSRQFWEYCWPKLCDAFPTLQNIPSHEFYVAMNRVKPSFIRVYADELTYPLHVILRYEIEQSLMNGSMEVEDVPAVWNKKMSEYLGIVPGDDLEGCLQDIHWSDGWIGYFPTYLLGAMYAAQIYHVAKEAIPDLEAKVAKGEFGEFREWLRVNAQMKGSLYASVDELMQSITGEPLNPMYYKTYLKTKYEELYEIA